MQVWKSAAPSSARRASSPPERREGRALHCGAGDVLLRPAEFRGEALEAGGERLCAFGSREERRRLWEDYGLLTAIPEHELNPVEDGEGALRIPIEDALGEVEKARSILGGLAQKTRGELSADRGSFSALGR